VTHTPGPWTVGSTLTNEGELPIVSEHRRVALVDCQSPPRRGERWKSNCAERDANACLIAAAPELLAALRLVVGLADNEAVESGDCRNPDNPFAIARAAIAKATT
jgi:hypothetical protein